MKGGYAERAPGRGARAMIVVTLLALVLVAAVPVALLAAVARPFRLGQPTARPGPGSRR